MTRGRKYASLTAAPHCAVAANEQLASGTSVVINGQTVPLSEDDKRVLQFLAACDEHKKEAFALWGALQELAGDDYQIVSNNFLSNAVTPPGYPDFFTRSKLKSADDAVATAAAQLSDALKTHPDLGVESAALNWPIASANHIAKGLQGLSWTGSSNPSDRNNINEPQGGDRDRDQDQRRQRKRREKSDSSKVAAGPSTMVTIGASPGGAGFPETTVRTGRLPWDIDINIQKNHVFNFVLSYSPTMSEMADVLARRARQLSSTRVSGTKRQTPNKIRFYAKWITEWLVGIYPDATAHHVASICAPIVWKRFNSDFSSAFETCKGIVDDLKHKRREQDPVPSAGS